MLNYTLKQLRYAEAAGRLGSIAAAATELSISQSSITAAIDALEGGLGYALFIRTPARGIQTTPQGAEALTLIRRFIQQSRHFEAEMQSVAGNLSGTLRLACYATAAPAVLPRILRGATQRHPGLSFTVLEGSLQRIMEFLNQGEADLAFSYETSVEPRHRFEPLFEAPPYAIVPKGDPIVARGATTLAELAQRSVVMLDLPGARDYFAAMFAAAGQTPRIAHSTRSSEILRALVGGGFGVSILNIRPLDYREGESEYSIVPIHDAIPAPRFGIVTLGRGEPPGLVQAFIDSCISLKTGGEFSELTVP